MFVLIRPLQNKIAIYIIIDILQNTRFYKINIYILRRINTDIHIYKTRLYS